MVMPDIVASRLLTSGTTYWRSEDEDCDIPGLEMSVSVSCDARC